MKMIHYKCGGELKEGPLTYHSDEEALERGEPPNIPMLLCLKCKQEIGGNSQIELVYDDGSKFEEA